MSFVDKFKNILHENEKVIESTCANKKSFITKRVIFPIILFSVVTIILTIVAICNPRHYVERSGNGIWSKPGHYEGFPLWVLFLVSGILLAIVLLVWLISNKAAKNYFICLTNERIIIRHGAFTTDYTYYAIDNVSGNITINCNQSIFDQNDANCAMMINIELLPVGHSELFIFTPSIVNGYEFSKKIDKQIKNNAKLVKPTVE